MELFTRYCRTIILPAFVTMKPHADKVRFDSQARAELLEVADSFDLQNIYTMSYDDKVKALQSAIRLSYSGEKLVYAVRQLFSAMCKELNDHNQLFPANRIDNPFS